jgi:hypothetical protein
MQQPVRMLVIYTPPYACVTAPFSPRVVPSSAAVLGFLLNMCIIDIRKHEKRTIMAGLYVWDFEVGQDFARPLMHGKPA